MASENVLLVPVAVRRRSAAYDRRLCNSAMMGKPTPWKSQAQVRHLHTRLSWRNRAKFDVGLTARYNFRRDGRFVEQKLRRECCDA